MKFNDIVFLVSGFPVELPVTANNKYLQKELAKKEIYIETKNTIVVTDNYNPMESLQVAKAEHY